MNVIDIRGTDNGAPAKVNYQASCHTSNSYPDCELYFLTCKIQSLPEQLFPLPTQVPALQPTPGILVMAVLFQMQPVHFIHTCRWNLQLCIDGYQCRRLLWNNYTANSRWRNVAQQSLTTTNVCQGTAATITYTGSSAPANAFTWNFNGGTVVSGSGAGPYSVVWIHRYI